MSYILSPYEGDLQLKMYVERTLVDDPYCAFYQLTNNDVVSVHEAGSCHEVKIYECGDPELSEDIKRMLSKDGWTAIAVSPKWKKFWEMIGEEALIADDSREEKE